MPNWVTNKLTVKGENADQILKSILTYDKDYECDDVDFNKILEMPKELQIERGSKSSHALKLQATKRYFDAEYYGTESDKLETKEFMDFVKKYFGEKALPHKHMVVFEEDEILRLQELYSLKELDELGDKLLHNKDTYGYYDWYEWSIDNWGTKWNACSTTISNDTTAYFDTAWSSCVPAIMKLAEKYPNNEFELDFAMECVGYETGRATFKNGELDSLIRPDDCSKEAYEIAFDLVGCEEDYRFDEKTGTYIYNDEAELG